MAKTAKESANYKKTVKFLNSKKLQEIVAAEKYYMEHPEPNIHIHLRMPNLLEFAQRYKSTRKTDRTISELIHAQIVLSHLHAHMNLSWVSINDDGPELFSVSKGDEYIDPHTWTFKTM